MENKKLLKFLLKDLGELDEMIAEKGSIGFDELEMEFLNTRVKGAKKLIQILHDRESTPRLEKKEERKIEEVEKQVEKLEIEEGVKSETEIKENSEVVQEKIIEQKEIVEEPIAEIEKELEEVSNEVIQPKEEIIEQIEEVELEDEIAIDIVEEKDVELEEEEQTEKADHRLGDSFSKEKSVNDLMSGNSGKLEHKLSNRPLANIQGAIGINDRFQFIRELFDGNAEIFSTAVSELDKMGDINEAVEYLRQNYKWKKNETSLKFVNLVKRRFLNE
ncbi:MAG: hypothetical protein HQ522_03880 [Bacteroidetes bacterium]|nr:hypothetical protein [Bacteroidota bacterium]